MSWSVSAIGSPSKVATKLKEEFGKITYLTGDEQVIKDLVAPAIIKAVEATMGGVAVKVEASGHASDWNQGNKAQNLTVKVEPVYGFVE